MDPYMQQSKLSYSYLGPGGGNGDAHNTGDRIAEAGYGRIITKSGDSQAVPGRSLSGNILSGGVGGNSYDSNMNAGGGSRSLPTSNAGSPVRTLQDKNRYQDSKQRTLGAIESFVVEGSNPPKYQQSVADYKMYERGNIIAASKFATPKQVETISAGLANINLNDVPNRSSHANQNGGTHNSVDHNKYYNSVYMVKPGAVSPTHSHSGSSRESNSPRTSMTGMSNYEYSKVNSPLYENIDYYNAHCSPLQVPPYYHQLPQSHSSPHSSLGSQDSKHSSPRTSYIASDSAIYESSYRKAQPQVPVGVKFSTASNKEYPPYEAPPVYENIQELNKPIHYEPAKPGPQVAILGEQKQVHVGIMSSQSTYMPPPYPGHSHSTVNIPQQQMAAVESRPHQQSLPTITRSTPAVPPTTPIIVTMGQTSLATSYQRPPMSGIAGSVSPPSPTPSAKMKPVSSTSGKNLLPYNVTPPRPMGPTEAERKIEELTRQLEEEMEKQEEEGEYFGQELNKAHVSLRNSGNSEESFVPGHVCS